MKANQRRYFRGGVVLLLCGLFALTGFFAMPTQRASAATPALVRIIHASPFIGSANIFVDGTQLLTAFGFGQVTDYVPLPPGQHTVQIFIVSKGINAFPQAVTLPAVQPGVAYTVAALGTSLNTLTAAVFVDDNRATPGTAKVRVYQLTPDGGLMNATSGSQMVASGVSYKNASNYISVSPGAYAVDMQSSAGKVSWSDTLKANTVTSLFAVGVFNHSQFPGEPQADIVASTATAVPGLPQTGSNPFISDGHLSTPWLFIIIAILFVGGTLFTRRLFAAH